MEKSLEQYEAFFWGSRGLLLLVVAAIALHFLGRWIIARARRQFREAQAAWEIEFKRLEVARGALEEAHRALEAELRKTSAFYPAPSHPIPPAQPLGLPPGGSGSPIP